jgi:hypothetical protein
VQHLFELAGTLGAKGCVNGMRAAGTSLERLLGPCIVEPLYGVARGLVVAAQRAGDPVGGLAPGASEQRIWQRRNTKASGERRPASKASRSASESGRTKIGFFMTQMISARLPSHLDMH